MEYPKINTLWMRDMEGGRKGQILEGQFACPEFEAIKYWNVTEKINGTNVRVEFTSEEVDTGTKFVYEFKGKNDDKSTLPPGVLPMLQNIFTTEKLVKQFRGSKAVTLFGEAYGGKIQKEGKLYAPEERFILFDAVIDGWWLEPDKVAELAKQLGVKSVPILFESMTVEQIVTLVKGDFASVVGLENGGAFPMEGVVCRAVPQMLFRKDKTPIMFKLKCRDYRRLLQ